TRRPTRTKSAERRTWPSSNIADVAVDGSAICVCVLAASTPKTTSGSRCFSVAAASHGYGLGKTYFQAPGYSGHFSSLLNCGCISTGRRDFLLECEAQQVEIGSQTVLSHDRVFMEGNGTRRKLQLSRCFLHAAATRQQL